MRSRMSVSERILRSLAPPARGTVGRGGALPLSLGRHPLLPRAAPSSPGPLPLGRGGSLLQPGRLPLRQGCSLLAGAALSGVGRSPKEWVNVAIDKLNCVRGPAFV